MDKTKCLKETFREESATRKIGKKFLPGTAPV